jgi:hypothetical protein
VRQADGCGRFSNATFLIANCDDFCCHVILLCEI